VLPGRLVNGQGEPISGATLDVLEQPVGARAPRLIAHAQTSGDGSFTAQIPGGPSRLITVAYRAYSGSPVYAAKATVLESVGAGITVAISTRHTSRKGKIKLTGRVQGPIPRHGVVIELTVRFLGRWEPFRTPRTDSKGHFKVPYRFRGTVGHFPFRIKVRGGQAGFPYAAGTSTVLYVTTH
jgi:hypothetical protein